MTDPRRPSATAGPSALPQDGGFARGAAELRGGEFDCVVVGGGIHGACLLLEAARRGQRALLVERGDYGRGASARSLRILHGGLRYLQSLDIARYGESVRARRWFLREFPEFTQPRAFLLPLDGRGLRRASAFRVAFALDAWLSRERNDGVEPSHQLPPGRVLGERELSGLRSAFRPRPAGEEPAPGMLGGADAGRGEGTRAADARQGAGPQAAGTRVDAGDPCRHAAYWVDGWIAEPQRLLIELLRWSASLGARVVNHTDPVRLLVESGRVTGLQLDQGGERIEVKTPLVLLAAGSWTESVLTRWGLSWRDELPTAMAFNVAVDGGAELGTVEGTRVAGVGVRARDGRNAFLWSDRGLTHVGTVHLNDRATPEETRVTRADVDSFLAAVDAHLPGLGLASRRVVSVTLGRLPARSWEDPEMPHRDRVFSGPEFGGPEGLGVVVGLKYTTAPEVARRILADCLPGVPAIERTRPTSRGPIRIPDLLLAWDRDPDEVVTLARDLQREEAAHSLSDLLLGRMDGTEDPVVVETLAVRLAPRLYAVPAEAECELTGVARALAPQRPVAP